jgi:hypothetical protein
MFQPMAVGDRENAVAQRRSDKYCSNSDRYGSNTATNETAATAIYRFQSCHNYEIRRLRCESHEGMLIIHGQVSSYYLKQLAQETIRYVVGDSRIVNRLEVVYVSSEVGANEPQ